MFKKENQKEKKHNIDNLPISTIISEGVIIEGNITGQEAIRVDGKIAGDVNAVKGIVLGEKAEVKGKIISEMAVIYGMLNGDLHCKTLYLQSTGVINGNIIVESLAVEMGGKYNGNLQMKTQQPAQPQSDRKSKS